MSKTEERKLISDASFAVIDVETTGMSAKQNRITEIGLVTVSNGEITHEFTTLLDPQQFIPEAITRLTGITNEMVYGKPKFDDVFPKLDSLLNVSDVFVGHNASFDFGFVNESIKRMGADELALPSLCTCRLARRLNRKLPSKSLSSISKYLGIHRKRKHRAIDDAKATAIILMHFIDRLIDEFHIETLDELLGFQYRKIFEMNKIPKSLKRIKIDLKDTPERPGVYFMKSRSGKILYIGKAKNLKYRVSSYFYHNVSPTRKIKSLIAHVHSIEFEQTNSELSALMLESKMIKLHKPKYNSVMRRYRRMPFIKIDGQNDFPRVLKTYEIKADGAKYYGPFRSSLTVNSLIERINKAYKLRKCDDVLLKPAKGNSTCMYFELKQCEAPCNFTQSQKDYLKEVKRVDKFLTSENEGALALLETKMTTLSEMLQYEEASFVRDEVNDLKKVILNMELTASDINRKNYIVKCRDENLESFYEYFFVVNGKLSHRVAFDVTESYDETEMMNGLINEIENLYFGGTLFGNVNGSAKQKYTVQELDELNLITNWICLNNTEKVVFKITPKTKLKDVVKFMLGDLKIALSQALS